MAVPLFWKVSRRLVGLGEKKRGKEKIMERSKLGCVLSLSV